MKAKTKAWRLLNKPDDQALTTVVWMVERMARMGRVLEQIINFTEDVDGIDPDVVLARIRDIAEEALHELE